MLLTKLLYDLHAFSLDKLARFIKYNRLQILELDLVARLYLLEFVAKPLLQLVYLDLIQVIRVYRRIRIFA